MVIIGSINLLVLVAGFRNQNPETKNFFSSQNQVPVLRET